MKDLAASGGYYIASAADYIYTEAGTITGSIGVITVSPNISGLLKKYSVEMRVYKADPIFFTLSMNIICYLSLYIISVEELFSLAIFFT